MTKEILPQLMMSLICGENSQLKKQQGTTALIPIVEDNLREAQRVGKDIDVLAINPSYANVLKSLWILLLEHDINKSRSL